MTDINDMRRDFEACCKKQRGINTSRDSTPRANGGSGEYLYACTNQAWWAWQAATERATVSQWQPIATAPMHQIVLVSVVGAGVTFGSRIGSCGWTWEEIDDEPADAIVSHWMPLPKPPVIRQGGAG